MTTAPVPQERRFPPIDKLADLAMVLVIIGGIYMAANLPGNISLVPAWVLLILAVIVLAVGVVLLARLDDFAWGTFRLVAGWALVACIVIAGMIGYAFVYDGTRRGGARAPDRDADGLRGRRAAALGLLGRALPTDGQASRRHRRHTLMRRRRGPVRTLTAAGAVAIAIAGAPLAGAAVYHGVVLGAKDFISAPAHGIGWGTPRPKTIFNGGDPSGYVSGIRWTTWGGRVAVGFGLTSLYKPGGGYYARPGRIELKALDIGHCDAGRAAGLYETGRPRRGAPRRSARRMVPLGRPKVPLQVAMIAPNCA